MKLVIAFCLTALAFLAGSGSFVVAEEGWKFPNLNPFSKTESPKTAKPAVKSKPRKSEASQASWWSGSPSAPATSSGPSTWDKMSTGTKNAWSKTKQTLMPWQQNSSPPAQRPVTGTNRMPGFSSTQKPAEKPGYFSSWFKTEEQQTKPKTVNEFLAQPRDDF